MIPERRRNNELARIAHRPGWVAGLSGAEGGWSWVLAWWMAWWRVAVQGHGRATVSSGYTISPPAARGTAADALLLQADANTAARRVRRCANVPLHRQVSHYDFATSFSANCSA